ncbi:MAG: hypothetical protein R2752_23405 [Vicinamibacterales bacterium]
MDVAERIARARVAGIDGASDSVLMTLPTAVPVTLTWRGPAGSVPGDSRS